MKIGKESIPNDEVVAAPVTVTGKGGQRYPSFFLNTQRKKKTRSQPATAEESTIRKDTTSKKSCSPGTHKVVVERKAIYIRNRHRRSWKAGKFKTYHPGWPGKHLPMKLDGAMGFENNRENKEQPSPNCGKYTPIPLLGEPHGG